MSEAISLPIDSTIQTVSGPILGSGGKILEFDLTNLTANKTVNVPDNSLYLPIIKTTDLALGNLSHSYTAGNNVLLGISSSLGGAHSNALVLGNSTASDASNQFKIKSDISIIRIPGLANAPATSVCKYSNVNNLWTYQAYSPSVGTMTVSNNATLNFGGDNTVGITQMVGKDNTISFIVGGSEICYFTQTQFVTKPNGSSIAPSLAFLNSTNSGVYRAAANRLGFTNNGVLQMLLDTQVQFPSGTKAAPGFSFIADSDTGIFYSGRPRIACGGDYVASLGQNVEAIQYGFLGDSTRKIILADAAVGFTDGTNYLDIAGNNFSLDGDLISGRVPASFNSLTSLGASNAWGYYSAVSPDGVYVVSAALHSNLHNVLIGVLRYTDPREVWTVADSVSLTESNAYTGTEAGGVVVETCFQNMRFVVGNPMVNSKKGYIVSYERTGANTYDSAGRSYITSPSNIANAQFGKTLGLSNNGRYLLVGEPGGRNGYGCAWLYTFTTGWYYTAQLYVDNLTHIQGDQVALSKDGNRALLSTNKGLIYVFEIPSGTYSATLNFGVEGTPYLAISGDGKVVVANIGTAIKVWRYSSTWDETAITGTFADTGYRGFVVDYRGDSILCGDANSACFLTYNGSIYEKGQSFVSGGPNQKLSASSSFETVVSNDYSAEISYPSIRWAASGGMASRLPVRADRNLVVAGAEPEYCFDESGQNCGFEWNSAGKMAITAGVDGKEFIIAADSVYCDANNYMSLGSNSNRWNEIFASNGTVVTSDMRLKEDIKQCPYGLAELENIEAYEYEVKNSQGTHLGFIAQEVEDVVGEVVVKDVIDGGVRYGMKYNEMIPVIINALKQLF